MKARQRRQTLRDAWTEQMKALDPSNWTEDEYAMQIDGSCLDPLIPDGSGVMVKKSATVTAGDIVVVWFRSEYLRPGATCNSWIKRMLPDMADGKLWLEQLNPPVRYWLKKEAVLAVHKAVGYVPAHLVKGDMIDPGLMEPLNHAGDCR